MTDEQIIKALRLCAIDGDVCTEACPYYEDREYFDGDCIKQRTIDAIDLINRQKAEIERLTDLINELAEANEGLLADNHDLYVRLKNREEEIDRLKEFEHMYNDLCK